MRSITKHEEKSFKRVRMSRMEKKKIRKQQQKFTEGEKIDDFRQLNDIKHYFEGDKQNESEGPVHPVPNTQLKKKIMKHRGRKLKKFKKKK